MKWVELFYFFFAVVHPLSELIPRTSLRRFLNDDYYGTHQEDFPVNKLLGIGGSLIVLVILVAPLLLFGVFGPGRNLVLGGWSLALGLVLADLIQHGCHAFAKPRSPAPWVHLITIVGVLIPLWMITQGLLSSERLWLLIPLVIGGLIIIVNWARNSWRLGKGQAVAAA